MNFSDVSDLLLTYIVTYGAIVLGVVFLVAAVGVPLPSTLCVVAGGAFNGFVVMNLVRTATLAIAGVGRDARRTQHHREVAFEIELLYPVVAAIRHVHGIVRPNSQTAGIVKLAFL